MILVRLTSDCEFAVTLDTDAVVELAKQAKRVHAHYADFVCEAIRNGIQVQLDEAAVAQEEEER